MNCVTPHECLAWIRSMLGFVVVEAVTSTSISLLSSPLLLLLEELVPGRGGKRLGVSISTSESESSIVIVILLAAVDVLAAGSFFTFVAPAELGRVEEGNGSFVAEEAPAVAGSMFVLSFPP